jgi:hypothetical protein
MKIKSLDPAFPQFQSPVVEPLLFGHGHDCEVSLILADLIEATLPLMYSSVGLFGDWAVY